MPSNYYDWRYSTDQVVAEDEAPMRFHPDGSPCFAKKEEDCPILNKAKKIDEADKLESAVSKESLEKIKSGQNPELENVVPVSIEDLPTFKETKSIYRKLRNDAYKSIIANNLGDGTYPLLDPSKKVQHVTDDGEVKDGFKDGFCVSFQTTNGEGFNDNCGTKRMSDEEYDEIVNDIYWLTGSVPYIGVFGGIPEISFYVRTKKQARELAKKYNQVSIANNKRIARGKWDNMMLTFPPNPDYDWRRNQIFKAR